MALGEIISEYKTTYTSIKVLPFGPSEDSIKIEGTAISEYSGRLSGRDVGTFYLTQNPHGKVTVAYYALLTTTDGDTVRIEGHGMGAVTEHGHTRARVTTTFQTATPALAWLNIALAIFEGEGNFASLEGVGVFYA